MMKEQDAPMLWSDSFHLFRNHATGDDSQAHGLKAGFSTFAGNWYVCSALSMAIGFALVVVDPAGVLRPEGHTLQHATVSVMCARYAYLALVLAAIMSSTLGVIISEFWLDDVSGIPAAVLPEYLVAVGSRDSRMAATYSYPILGLKLNVYAMLPLCYLQHGMLGFVLAVVMCSSFLTILGNEHRKRKRARAAFNDRLGLASSWDSGDCDCSPWGAPFLVGTVF